MLAHRPDGAVAPVPAVAPSGVAARLASLVAAARLAPAVAALAGCSVAIDGDDGLGSAAGSLGGDATLRFTADWRIEQSGPLTLGHDVALRYDPARLPQCRGDYQGHEGWLITAYHRVAGGRPGELVVAGYTPPQSQQPPSIHLGTPGDLELWFFASSIYGCGAYDSDYGRNYHFTVEAPPDAPGWVGAAAVATSRATCGDGGACDQDFHPLDDGFTYDAWVRTRAAIRQARFEVWKQGVTDRDNPDLWRQLDVQVHVRVGDAGPFEARYVAFDARTGNNARYALDLRGLDPIPGPARVARRADCPAGPLAFAGATVSADVQFYFTVNGVELRPARGGAFHGTYQNDAALYDVCR